MKNFFIKLAMLNTSNTSTSRRNNNNKRGCYLTPERRVRMNRLETGIRSESVNRRRNTVQGSSPAESPRGTPFRGLTILQDPMKDPSERNTYDFIVELRDKERLEIIKIKVEEYRSFIESFELPSKLHSRLLLSSAKHKIRNPKNFQYSLGIPKKVIFDVTSVNINGLNGDLKKLKGYKNLAKFKTNNRLRKFPLFIPNKPFYICQGTCINSEDCEKRMVELGIFATSEISESNIVLINYSSRKVLINAKFKFKDDYRCKRNGLYSNINFNMPLLHIFNSKKIRVLNYHRSVKFGGKRIINKIDLIKRKLIPSKEIKHIFDPKEKLEDIIRIPATKFYFFLKFNLEKKVTLLIYDFDLDERIEIGEIETMHRIRDGNKNVYSVINPGHLCFVNRRRIEKFILEFKDRFCSFPEKFDMNDVMAILDINFLLSYKECQNFFCFVTKSNLRAYCLEVSPLVLLDEKFTGYGDILCI